VARQYSHRRTAHKLHDCQIVAQLSASHGSRFLLAFVVRTGNQGLAKRLGASPNRPVWIGAAVQAPKERRSRETTARCIKGLENVNRSIYGPSQPRHTLVLERIPATNRPSGQTVPRLAVWTVGAIGGDALTSGASVDALLFCHSTCTPVCHQAWRRDADSGGSVLLNPCI